MLFHTPTLTVINSMISLQMIASWFTTLYWEPGSDFFKKVCCVQDFGTSNQRPSKRHNMVLLADDLVIFGCSLQLTSVF